MSDIMMSFSKEVLDALISGYMQELGILGPAQELELTSLVLEDDNVEIEADITEGTLQ